MTEKRIKQILEKIKNIKKLNSLDFETRKFRVCVQGKPVSEKDIGELVSLNFINDKYLLTEKGRKATA